MGTFLKQLLQKNSFIHMASEYSVATLHLKFCITIKDFSKIYQTSPTFV